MRNVDDDILHTLTEDLLQVAGIATSAAGPFCRPDAPRPARFVLLLCKHIKTQRPAALSASRDAAVSGRRLAGFRECRSLLKKSPVARSEIPTRAQNAPERRSRRPK